MVKEAPNDIIELEPEYVPVFDDIDEPYTIEIDPKNEHIFIVDGPKIEKMLGYTNLDSEKGFDFFQRFMKENGIIDALKEKGLEDGDVVRIYDLEFDYYD